MSVNGSAWAVIALLAVALTAAVVLSVRKRRRRSR
jgi:hypothetical protein